MGVHAEYKRIVRQGLKKKKKELEERFENYLSDHPYSLKKSRIKRDRRRKYNHFNRDNLYSKVM